MHPKSSDWKRVIIIVWAQDCVSAGGLNFITAVGKAGAVDAMVETLKHESPYCIAAAASCLGYVSTQEDVGKRLIEESGAIPALVDVIQSSIPAADLKKEKGLFRKYAPLS
jgi:hypothetical protein